MRRRSRRKTCCICSWFQMRSTGCSRAWCCASFAEHTSYCRNPPEHVPKRRHHPLCRVTHTTPAGTLPLASFRASYTGHVADRRPLHACPILQGVGYKSFPQFATEEGCPMRITNSNLCASDNHHAQCRSLRRGTVINPYTRFVHLSQAVALALLHRQLGHGSEPRQGHGSCRPDLFGSVPEDVFAQNGNGSSVSDDFVPVSSYRIEYAVSRLQKNGLRVGHGLDLGTETGSAHELARIGSGALTRCGTCGFRDLSGQSIRYAPSG